MCGIGGYFGEGDIRTLERMNKELAHRGPDGSGAWTGSRVGFAHRRLAIIDLSAGGAQPMHRGRYTITFNGEIYNYKELRTELLRMGLTFTSQSNTEVILALFETYGEKAVERLEGMFAFALYDAQEDSLLLARDRFGEKPLYWAMRAGTVVFGSEAKALFAHPAVTRAVNPAGLAAFMLYDTPLTPLSIWSGMEKVPTASWMKFQNGTYSSHRYWRPAFQTKIPDSDVLTQLDALLRESVARQLVGDVPMGVFLSGGIDSSLIAAYTKELAGEAHTFSVGFEDASYDESQYARMVAKHLGTRHEEHVLSATDVRDALTLLAEKLDEPLADPAVLPSYLLSFFARKEVTVALSGDGGDELFLGYPTFVAEKFLRMYQYAPRSLRRMCAQGARALPPSHKYMSMQFLVRQFLSGSEEKPLYAHRTWLGGFSWNEVREVLADEYGHAIANPQERTSEIVADVHELPALTQSSWWYARTLLELYLTKADRASMCASLETRAPFLDRALAEFALSLPPSQKLRWGTGKYCLRKVASQKLPGEIAWRKKHGFGLPVSAWLRIEWRGLLTDMLSAESVSRAGLCKPQAVTRLVTEHLSGECDHRKKLWPLLTLHLWHDAWMR